MLPPKILFGLFAVLLPLAGDELTDSIPALMHDAKVPGISIVVIEHGRISWQGFGVKDANRPGLVDARTIFEAASLSKPVFAYAVLRLVDQGKLDLDTPVSKYVPDYISDDRLSLITIRRVLTHTTGLPNWRPGGKTLVIHFTPGERFSYSGEGFVFLQHAVEHLTGEPLERLAEEMVFRPLGMSDSSYVWRNAYEATTASGHNQDGVPSRKNKPHSANAASSLHTTAPDYANFMIALMTRKGLSRKLAREMLSPQVSVDAGCFNCIAKPRTHPAATCTGASVSGWKTRRMAAPFGIGAITASSAVS